MFHHFLIFNIIVFHFETEGNFTNNNSWHHELHMHELSVNSRASAYCLLLKAYLAQNKNKINYICVCIFIREEGAE